VRVEYPCLVQGRTKLTKQLVPPISRNLWNSVSCYYFYLIFHFNCCFELRKIYLIEHVFFEGAFTTNFSKLLSFRDDSWRKKITESVYCPCLCTTFFYHRNEAKHSSHMHMYTVFKKAFIS
jgi:hypothetical protein